MKLTLLTAALVAVLALAGVPVRAQTNTATSTTSTTSSTTTMPVMKKIKYMGTLTAIDATANTITVQGAKATMTLMITPTTKYRGGNALAEFAVGDKVTGSYTKDSTGAMTAYSLHKKKMK